MQYMLTIEDYALEASKSYNEAEIRLHIIDPILRNLGYLTGDGVYLKLEEKLDYPYFHIGHKSKKKDLPLGYSDYRAGLKGRRGSFIVEAKSGNTSITKKDVEQAHSYAAHAQVGANYFVLCGGFEICVYETLSGPEAAPIIYIPMTQINDRFHELENVLSPLSLAKNCAVEYDLDLKLCEGLASSVQVRSGEYDMSYWAYRIFINGTDCTEFIKTAWPALAEVDRQLAMIQNEFELKIADGLTERDPDGRINAHIHFSGVTKNNLEAMRLLGIEKMTFSTNEKFLSVDPSNPTIFESTSDFSLAKGTMVPPLFGDAVSADTDMTGDIFVAARMHKDEDSIVGEYVALANYWLNLPDVGDVTVELDVAGRFSLRLLL